MKRDKQPRDNPGWFRRGPDPRRHQFTTEECVEGGIRGFRACLEKRPELYSYLMARALAAGRRRSAHRKERPG